MKKKMKKIFVCASTSVFFALFLLVFLLVRSNGLAPSIECVNFPGWVHFADSTYAVSSVSDFSFPKGTHVGDTLSLRFSIPAEKAAGKVLRIRTYHAALVIFENGKEIYSYGVDRAKERNMVGSGVHHVPLHPDGSTENLEFRFVITIGEDLSSMPDIDLLPAPYAISDFFSRHAFALVVGVFLVLFGTLAVLVSLATAFYGVKAFRSFLIGVFSFVMGTWTLCYMKLFQIISYNFALNTSVEYFCLYFAPLPFCLLLIDMRRGNIKRWKWWGIVVVTSVGFLLLLTTTILHFTNLVLYPRTLMFFHAYVVLGLLYFLLTGILYGKKMDLSVKMISIGVLVFAVVAIADLLRHNVNNIISIEHSLLELTWIPFGSLLFVLMLVGSYMVYLFRLQEVRAEKDFLATMAYADSLTGLYNRAKSQQIFDAIDKTTVDFAIVCFDMNGLKFVNDTYGHQAGDAVIKAFSAVLKDSFAGFGTAIRMGGDEFMAIVRMEHLNDLDAVMANFAKLKTVYSKGLPISLDAAYGIAYRHEIGESANCKMVLHAADKKMYAMKSAMKSNLVRK